MKTLRIPFNVGILPAFFLLFLAIGGWWFAQGWGRSSGMFPRLFGQVFMTFALVELGIQLWKSFVSHHVSEFDTSEFFKQLWAIAWLGLLLAMIYVLGFMVTVPLFVFLFLRLHGRIAWVLSTALAIGAAVFVEVIFRRLLDYTLYSGFLG